MAIDRPQALFLHSAFRSGSTWFWNRFRRAAGTCAYYEPFNEALASLDAERLAANAADRWPAGHPRLDAPYFAEYASLLRPGGGVAGFLPRFAYQSYFADGADEEQRRYLAGLIDGARQSGAVPVLGFCRSLVRLPWLRRHCPGLHIATWRNPWDQWASCHHQTLQYKNPYFEFRSFLIANIGNCDETYHDFFEDLYLPPFLKISPAGREEALYPFFYAAHVDHRFRVFLRVFMLDMLTALTHADLVVDLDRMSGEPAYRQATGRHLRDLSGLADLSFEDCALPRHPYHADAAYLAVLDEALAFLDRYGTRFPPAAPEGLALAELTRRMAECRRDLSAAAGDFANGIVAEQQADLDRYMLCHLLFAARRMARPGGGDGDGPAYLRAVYGADYPLMQGDLARLADLVGALGANTSAETGERLACRRLGRVLAGTPK